jgi:outer membrane lipoprotein SlyB
MRRHGNVWAVVALVMVGCSAGCAVSQSAPPPPRAFGEVDTQERGVVVTVRDIMVDRRTGRGPDATVQTPHIPLGPIAVAVPISLGGERRQDVPGEEITVRLAGEKLIVVVQETSSPALGPGERVLVQREKPSLLTGEARSRVVRDDDYSVIRPAR